jgi:hypothetical protein
MTTGEALEPLILFLRSGQRLHEAGGDDRGPESIGEELSLRFDGGSFTLTEARYHKYAGHLDEEHETRRTRDENGLRELLGCDRSLLIRLLLTARRLPQWPHREGRASPRARMLESIDEILSALATGPVWLPLSQLSGVREEGLVFRLSLGWRQIELDGGREVGLDALVRDLGPLEEETAAARVQHLLKWGGPAAAQPEPLPADILAALERIERSAAALTPVARKQDRRLWRVLRELWPTPTRPLITAPAPALVPLPAPSADVDALVRAAEAALISGSMLGERRERSADGETRGIERELKRRADGLFELREARWCQRPPGARRQDEERQAGGQSALQAWLRRSVDWLPGALGRA